MRALVCFIYKFFKLNGPFSTVIYTLYVKKFHLFFYPMCTTQWSKIKEKSYLLGWEVEGQDKKFSHHYPPESFNLPKELKYMK